MDGTSICEAMVKASMIPGSAATVRADREDHRWQSMTAEPHHHSYRQHVDSAWTEQECAAVANPSGGILWNPWPALERWWRRRRRVFWLPTTRNRPKITLEMLTDDDPMTALADWAFDFHDWNRARRFWKVVIVLASLSLTGIVANTLLERQLAGTSLPNTSIGMPTD